MKRHKIKILLVLSVGFIFHSSFAQANCKDPELRQKVTQTAKAEGVNENELLSIIAHESRCHYYTIAWNLPGKASSAKSKFLDSLNEAKSLAEELSATKSYRVDVGIGQINYEANIRKKGWSLEEVLNPETALSYVAEILKERTWNWYHSSNPAYANKWKKLAASALSQIHSGSEIESLETKINSKIKASFIQISSLQKRKAQSNLIVYNGLDQGSSTEPHSFISKKNSNHFVIYP